MAELQMNERLWRASQQLAAELAQRDFDNNLLRTAATYTAAYPEGDLRDWLNRLVRLGNIFSSSDQTGKYRHELQEACQRLSSGPANNAEWSLVLGWAARLQPYYRGHLRVARQISDVSGLILSRPPAAFQPPRPVISEDDLPEVREEVSQEAKDLFAELEALWSQQDEEGNG